MSLFDPYSHVRLQELRQEQLALKARRRETLRIDDEPFPGFRDGTARMLRALAARIATTEAGRTSPTAPSVHPEAR